MFKVDIPEANKKLEGRIKKSEFDIEQVNKKLATAREEDASLLETKFNEATSSLKKVQTTVNHEHDEINKLIK